MNDVNEKYYFVRRSIISYYARLHNLGEDVPYTFQDLMKFYECCFLSYLRERNLIDE